MWILIVPVLFLLQEQTHCGIVNISVNPLKFVFYTRETTASKCPNNTLVDVTFVLEYFEGIGTANWGKVAQFVEGVINLYKLGPKDARFAAVAFSKDTVRLFDLRNITVAVEAYKALKGNGTLNAKSYTDQVYNAIMGWNMFTNKGSGRAKASSFIVYATDGSTTFLTRSTEPFKKLGVTIISIGVGNYVEASKLREVSAPNMFFPVPDFEVPTYVKSNIVNKTCAV